MMGQFVLWDGVWGDSLCCRVGFGGDGTVCVVGWCLGRKFVL